MIKRCNSFAGKAFFYRLSGLFFLMIMVSVSKGAEITLSDAISKGLVKAVIKGNPNDTSKSVVSSYFGPCLQLNLQSLSNTTLNLKIESGRFLETLDTTEQRMMVTHDELITLQPAKKKSFMLCAMCTQMHDHSPGKESLLAMGKMSEGNLLTLAQFIGKNNFQSLAAQQAVWVITDDNDLGSIFSENADEMNKLQSFVSKLTGKLPPPAPHTIFYSSGMVSGEITFENKQRETYSFIMLNEANETIGRFFENKTIEIPMITTLNWRFRFSGFPKGVYYVKLLNSKKEAVVTRPVVID
jgi:hypothetical protein